jgi:hypothetical protein
MDTLLADTGTTGIIFNDTVTGPHNLTLSASNGSIAAASTINVTSLIASCGENALFAGTITTNGTVDIASTGGSVSVNAVDSNGGAILLQPASGFTIDGGGGNIPDGLLILQGSLDAGAGTISLSPAGRAELQSIATIIGNPAGGDLFITADTLTIGSNESVTVLGDINWTVAGTATLGGDVIALNGITIQATTIEIYLHNPGMIYNFLGTLYPSNNTFILCRDGINLLGTQTTIGPGAPATVELVALSSPEFLLELFYMGDVLDYALGSAPPPPPPPPQPSPNPLIRREIAAEAELSISELLTLRLPIPWNMTTTRRPYFCLFYPLDRECSIFDPPPFKFFVHF